VRVTGAGFSYAPFNDTFNLLKSLTEGCTWTHDLGGGDVIKAFRFNFPVQWLVTFEVNYGFGGAALYSLTEPDCIGDFVVTQEASDIDGDATLTITGIDTFDPPTTLPEQLFATLTNDDGECACFHEKVMALIYDPNVTGPSGGFSTPFPGAWVGSLTENCPFGERTVNLQFYMVLIGVTCFFLLASYCGNQRKSIESIPCFNCGATFYVNPPLYIQGVATLADGSTSPECCDDAGPPINMVVTITE
jgi:hypothetical protein